MQINKPKMTKKLSKEGIIYSAIFILYIAILALVFIYSIKFLNNALKFSLSTPQEDVAAKYGQLDLGNYALLVDRLGLEKPITPGPAITAPEPSASVTPVYNLSTSPAVTSTITILPGASSTTSPETTTSSAVIIPTPGQSIVPPVVQTKLKIMITNSTPTLGLATILKNKLVAAGYEVATINSSRPTQASTTIMIKPSFQNSIDAAAIEKIVGSDYLSTIQDLAESAAYDLEIIIGSK